MFVDDFITYFPLRKCIIDKDLRNQVIELSKMEKSVLAFQDFATDFCVFRPPVRRFASHRSAAETRICV